MHMNIHIYIYIYIYIHICLKPINKCFAPTLGIY